MAPKGKPVLGCFLTYNTKRNNKLTVQEQNNYTEQLKTKHNSNTDTKTQQ